MFQDKRRDMGLGSYPTISLADARLKRDQNKRLLAEGIDPIEAAIVSKAHQEAYVEWRVSTGMLDAIAPLVSADPILKSYEIHSE